MVNIGIIGCGYIGRRHAEHIHAHPGAKLSGVYDIDTKAATDLAEAFDSEAFMELDKFLKLNLDIVHVCTPNGLHAELSIEVLKSGKNVLVEKPMEINSTSAAQMLACARENSKEIFVVKQNRYNPPVQRLKKLISEQGLGRVFQVDVRCYWNRNKEYYDLSSWRGSLELDGGCLYTQFSHFIDVLYFLFGRPTAVQGRTANFQHPYIAIEDSGSFSFQLPNEVLGSLTYSTCAFNQNIEGSITVLAEKGSLKIGGKYLNSIEFVQGLEREFEDMPHSAPANNYGFYEGSMSNHNIVIDEVVRFHEGQLSGLTSGEDGLAVVEIIESFYNNSKRIHG